MPASTDTESYRFSLRVPTISPSPNTDARAIRSQSRGENYAERAAPSGLRSIVAAFHRPPENPRRPDGVLGRHSPFDDDYAKALYTAGWPKDVPPYQARHTVALKNWGERGVDLWATCKAGSITSTSPRAESTTHQLVSRLKRASGQLAGRFGGWESQGASRAMKIPLDLPDDVARQLPTRVRICALEALAINAYRRDRITGHSANAGPSSRNGPR